MNIIEFLKREEGAISVDWVVLSTAAALMCLAAAGILSTATDSFARYNARELSIQNYAGSAFFQDGVYVPEDDALYAAYVDGLSGLTLDQLDALAGFANRLHASGYGGDVGGTDTGPCYNCGAGSEVANTNDFLMAVDQEYVTRGAGRPAHTHIDSHQIGAAFESMGLTQSQVRALLQG